MKSFYWFYIFICIINSNKSVVGDNSCPEDCSKFDSQLPKEVTESQKYYNDCCESNFIYVVVLNERKHIIKFVSSKSWTEKNESANEMSLPIEMSSVDEAFGLRGKTKFAVVVRVVTKIYNRGNYKNNVSVTVSDRSDAEVVITLKGSKTYAEKRIQNVYTKDDSISLRFTNDENKRNLFLNESYVVFCSSQTPNTGKYETDGCEPQFKDYKVWCICKENQKSKKTSFLTFIAISIFWFVMLFAMFLCKIKEQKPTKPETQFSLIMCSARSASFLYEITFRVGCPSENFDMEKTTIDIEMIGSQHQPIGQMLRFSANKLTDPVMAEMRCLMAKITPIPNIEEIRAIHSGRPNSQIFFYDMTVVDVDIQTQDRQMKQTMLINDYIRNYSVVFKGQDKNDDQMAYYPEIPVPELSYFEIQLIVFFITSIIATFCMLLSSNTFKGDSLLNSVFTVILSSIIALTTQTVVIYLYKYQIKKNDFEERYSEANENNKWTKIRYTLWGVMIFFIFLMTGFVAYFGFKQTWTQSFFWLGSCLCTAGIVFGVWLIADAMHISICNQQNILSKDDEKEVPSVASSLSTTGSQTESLSQVTSFNEMPRLSPSPTVSVDSNIGNVAEFKIKKKDQNN